jgi:hypothetical protein
MRVARHADIPTCRNVRAPAAGVLIIRAGTFGLAGALPYRWSILRREVRAKVHARDPAIFALHSPIASHGLALPHSKTHRKAEPLLEVEYYQCPLFR